MLDIAEMMRGVQNGTIKPRPKTAYLLDMDTIQVERTIWQMYHANGLPEQGDSRWYRFVNSLEFNRIEEQFSFQVEKNEDKGNPSPTLMEKVTYFDNQRVKTPVKPIGDRIRRNKLNLEIVNGKNLDKLKGGQKQRATMSR